VTYSNYFLYSLVIHLRFDWAKSTVPWTIYSVHQCFGSGSESGRVKSAKKEKKNLVFRPEKIWKLVFSMQSYFRQITLSKNVRKIRWKKFRFAYLRETWFKFNQNPDPDGIGIRIRIRNTVVHSTENWYLSILQICALSYSYNKRALNIDTIDNAHT
jgi:hypothetical protein